MTCKIVAERTRSRVCPLKRDAQWGFNGAKVSEKNRMLNSGREGNRHLCFPRINASPVGKRCPRIVKVSKGTRSRVEARSGTGNDAVSVLVPAIAEYSSSNGGSRNSGAAREGEARWRAGGGVVVRNSWWVERVARVQWLENEGARGGACFWVR